MKYCYYITIIDVSPIILIDLFSFMTKLYVICFFGIYVCNCRHSYTMKVVACQRPCSLNVSPWPYICMYICMYTKPLIDIIQRHGLSHHSYADGTQLYMTMDHSNNDWRDGLARIELCVSEIREWMNQNILKLNDDKTELVVFTWKYK